MTDESVMTDDTYITLYRLILNTTGYIARTQTIHCRARPLLALVWLWEQSGTLEVLYNKLTCCHLTMDCPPK